MAIYLKKGQRKLTREQQKLLRQPLDKAQQVPHGDAASEWQEHKGTEALDAWGTAIREAGLLEKLEET